MKRLLELLVTTPSARVHVAFAVALLSACRSFSRNDVDFDTVFVNTFSNCLSVWGYEVPADALLHISDFYIRSVSDSSFSYFRQYC